MNQTGNGKTPLLDEQEIIFTEARVIGEAFDKLEAQRTQDMEAYRADLRKFKEFRDVQLAKKQADWQNREQAQIRSATARTQELGQLSATYDKVQQAVNQVFRGSFSVDPDGLKHDDELLWAGSKDPKEVETGLFSSISSMNLWLWGTFAAFAIFAAIIFLGTGYLSLTMWGVTLSFLVVAIVIFRHRSIEVKKTRFAIGHDVQVIKLRQNELERQIQDEWVRLGAAIVREKDDENNSPVYRQMREDIEQRRREADARANSESQRIQQLVASLNHTVVNHAGEIERLHPVWEKVSIPSPEGASSALPIGTCEFQAGEASFSMPYMYLPQGNLVLTTAGSAAKSDVGIQSVIARAIAAFPPGQLKLLVIDPVGLGQNASLFMRLADHDESLVTSRAWSESRHIEQRLADLTEHIENVIQKYLRNEYPDIATYNAEAVGVPEAYRLLVVYDFPARFGQDSTRQLLNIMQNGPRCGVYTVLVLDESQEVPFGVNLTELKRSALVLQEREEVFVGEAYPDLSVTISLLPPPGAAVFNKIVDQIGTIAKESSKVVVNLESLLQDASHWWESDSGPSLRALLGPSGARKTQYLEFGLGTAHHGLVVGRTGSGKSVLLHTLITSLITSYSPKELELYLVDFKEGVEFKRYANNRLPHAKVIAIRSEREFGLSVLQGVDKEIAERGGLFKDVDARNLSEARSKSGKNIPRVLIVIDEFQVLFAEDDKIKSESLVLLDRIVRQGRSFGVHVLLCSQTLAGSANLPRSIMDQMYVRIALQCSAADSQLILSEDNPAARLLSRPGEAIYNASNGTIEGNYRFQTAILGEETQERVLKTLHAMATEHEVGFTPLIFEGNDAASIEENDIISPLAAGPWPSEVRCIALLGEPTSIKDPTSVVFKRQSGNNLLVVGSNEKATLDLLATTALSLAVQQSPQRAKFYVLDFSGNDERAGEGYLQTVKRLLPHDVRIGKRKELAGMFEELDGELKSRIAMDSLPTTLPTLYLIIAGLQRARDLRADDSWSDEPARTPQIVSDLLREGPEMGIHLLVSCDNMANLSRTVFRRGLKEFDYRICFQMGTEDSMTLLDTNVASKLGANRAYIYSVEEGKMEKFRPYSQPGQEWLTSLGEALQSRPTL